MCFGLSLVAGLWGLWFIFSANVDLKVPGLLSSYRIYGTYDMLFGTGFFWCTIFLSTVVCIIPIFVLMVSNMISLCVNRLITQGSLDCNLTSAESQESLCAVYLMQMPFPVLSPGLENV